MLKAQRYRTAATIGAVVLSITAASPALGQRTQKSSQAVVTTPAAALGKGVKPSRPVPPSSDSTLTWSGSGTTVTGDVRSLTNSVCDATSTPYLVWVLSGTKASAATITLPDSETPYTMTKANRNKRGYSTFKFVWHHDGLIEFGSADGTPTVDGAAVTVEYLNARMRGNLSIEVGCRGAEPMLNIGDTGTGGGKVFFVSVAPFTSAGSACNTSCHYLEFAPAGWAPLVAWPNDVTYNGATTARTDANIDPVAVWSDGAFTNVAADAVSVGTAIGTGMSNTTQTAANTDTTAKGQRFAFQAVAAYAGSGSSLGDWFVPSRDELNEFCKYVRGQVADLGNTSVQCTATATKDVTVGLVNDELYWSSTYGLFDSGQTAGYQIMNNVNSSYIPGSLINQYYSTYGIHIRPVRAF